MKNPRKQFGFSRTILALSVLAAFGLAHAEEDDVAQLVNPHSTVSVGLSAASGDSKDRTIFNQYSGLRDNNSNLLLDYNIVKRNDATGLWTTSQGNNLGLDNRDLSFSQNKQGDWKYSIGYSELVRHDPRTINTGVQGVGTSTLTVSSLAAPGAGTDLNLEIKRSGISLSGEKWLTSNLMLEVTAKNEDKKGARLSGTGIACTPAGMSSITCSSLSAAMLMLPEPIDSTTKQIEARLNFSGDKLLLSGGYYGSFYSNANGSLNSTLASWNLYNPDGSTLATTAAPGSILAGLLQQPVALPPDNQANQVYVSGHYAFTPTTHSTFKYAYTHATQNETFSSMGLTGMPSGVNNLAGVVDSNVAQFGLTARPIEKLSLLGNVHYASKDDKTPLAAYSGAYTNDTHSSKKLNGKLEAGYALPQNLRATLGVDYESEHRDAPVSTAAVLNAALNPLTGLREDTHEVGYRAELKRSMTETINAVVSYVQSKRDGGSWLNIGPANPVGTYPMTMMDRKRDKVKLSGDWTPTNKLSLQFLLENGKDTYTGPTAKGLRDTGMNSYGVDAELKVTDFWKMTGYVSQSTQTQHVDYSTGYLAELKNTNTNFGVGVVGNPSSKLELGGNLLYVNDNNSYQQSMASGTPIVGGGLPDVTNRVISLKLYGKYALQTNAYIRADMVYQNAKTNEWTWDSFTYSDNTTVSMQPNQKAVFLGASYIYQF